MLHSQFPVSDFHPLNVKFKWCLKNKIQRWIFLHNLHSHADWLNVVAGSSLYLNTTWKHLILHLQGAHPRGGEGRHDCSLLQASHLIRPGFHHFPKSAHLIFHSGGAQGSCQGVVLVGNGHQQAHPWLRLHWQGEPDCHQTPRICNSLRECCVMPKGSKKARLPIIWTTELPLIWKSATMRRVY